MPVTPSGISKFLHSHGFERSEPINVAGHIAWTEGFRTEAEHDGSVAVWFIGLRPATKLREYIDELIEYGYELEVDDSERTAYITARDREWSRA